MHWLLCLPLISGDQSAYYSVETATFDSSVPIESSDDENDEDVDEDEEDVPTPCSVKLIDFAHTKFVPGEGPDLGSLKGLDTVLGLFDGRIEVVRVALGGVAN